MTAVDTILTIVLTARDVLLARDLRLFLSGPRATASCPFAFTCPLQMRSVFAL